MFLMIRILAVFGAFALLTTAEGAVPAEPGAPVPSQTPSDEVFDRLAELIEQRSVPAAVRGDAWRSALADARRRCSPHATDAELAVIVRDVLAATGDAAAAVRVAGAPLDPIPGHLVQFIGPGQHKERDQPAHLPFLLAPLDAQGKARFAALGEERSRFIEHSTPFVRSINGVAIADWLDAPMAMHGGPQPARLAAACRSLGSFEAWRSALGLERTNDPVSRIRVVFESEDGARTRERAFTLWVKPVADQRLPSGGSRLLPGGIAYLRPAHPDRMPPDEVRARMPGFQQTHGLILDVRGGGGRVSTLAALIPYLREPDDPAIVYMCSREPPSEEATSDHRRHPLGLREEDDEQLLPSEQAAIRAFRDAGVVRSGLSAERFGAWRYGIVDHRRWRDPDAQRAFYRKPVVVLLDPADPDLAPGFVEALLALKKASVGPDRATITLVASGDVGGSPATRWRPLAGRFQILLTTAEVYGADGELLAGDGRSPDVTVPARPQDLLRDGTDTMLERAMAMIPAPDRARR